MPMNEKHISAHTNSSVQQMQREGKVVAKKVKSLMIDDEVPKKKGIYV